MTTKCHWRQPSFLPMLAWKKGCKTGNSNNINRSIKALSIPKMFPSNVISPKHNDVCCHGIILDTDTKQMLFWVLINKVDQPVCSPINWIKEIYLGGRHNRQLIHVSQLWKCLRRYHKFLVPLDWIDSLILSGYDLSSSACFGISV